jgi:hypothetical protein
MSHVAFIGYEIAFNEVMPHHFSLSEDRCIPKHLVILLSTEGILKNFLSIHVQNVLPNLTLLLLICSGSEWVDYMNVL